MFGWYNVYVFTCCWFNRGYRSCACLVVLGFVLFCSFFFFFFFSRFLRYTFIFSQGKLTTTTTTAAVNALQSLPYPALPVRCLSYLAFPFFIDDLSPPAVAVITNLYYHYHHHHHHYCDSLQIFLCLLCTVASCHYHHYHCHWLALVSFSYTFPFVCCLLEGNQEVV